MNQVLVEYNLETNDSKYEKFDYLKYNDFNTLTKEWKRVISIQKQHERYIGTLNDDLDEGKEPKKYYMNFTNQLIYRISNLKEDKLRSVFAKNFFKSSYFKNMDPINYKFTKENMHQLEFIMSENPETILYIVPKFKNMRYFVANVSKWIDMKFILSLDLPFHEEQMYYLFGAMAIGKYSKIVGEKLFIRCMDTDNIILKSYMIMFHLPKDIDPTSYLKIGEKNWFLNYHILLKKYDITNIENDIEMYLLPDSVITKLRFGKAIGTQKKNYYLNFYKDNIINKKCLIKDYAEVTKELEDYLELKEKERIRHVSEAQNFME